MIAWRRGLARRRATVDRRANYYVSNLPADATIKTLAATIKARWVRKQAHQQFKEELAEINPDPNYTCYLAFNVLHESIVFSRRRKAMNFLPYQHDRCFLQTSLSVWLGKPRSGADPLCPLVWERQYREAPPIPINPSSGNNRLI
jgi:hypothetical protein